MSDGSVEEVTREKLELSPSFKVEEYGLQLKFYQKDREVGIKGYCLKNFDKPECASDAKWGKIVITLASFRKHEMKLNKGLERRKIQMGLSTAYVRKIAHNNEGTEFECSYVRAGSGFKTNHWHDEIDVENIIQKRIEQHKQVRIAGKQNNGDLESILPYCGKKDAFVEYKDEAGEWKQGENSQVTEEKETKTSLVENKSMPSRGLPRSRQLGHDNIDMVDGFNTALSPVVAQPR